jgi:adenosylcobinamide-GDP ribazoletransferase
MKRLRMLNPLFHALAFLTRLPAPDLSATKDDWQRSVAYYPVVGLLIGLLLWGVSPVLTWLFPQPMAAVWIIVFWVYITGGLHLDGWMDLADGFGSNRSKEEVLNIMKDSRVGAMGVIAAVLLLSMKTTAVQVIQTLDMQKWLAISPLYARTVLLLAIRFFPYIRENGIGTDLRLGLTSKRMFVSCLFAGLIPLVMFSSLTGLIGLAVGFVTCIVGWGIGKAIASRLGGLTGDCYGALVECTEVCFLVLLIIIQKWLPL